MGSPRLPPSTTEPEPALCLVDVWVQQWVDELVFREAGESERPQPKPMRVGLVVGRVSQHATQSPQTYLLHLLQTPLVDPTIDLNIDSPGGFHLDVSDGAAESVCLHALEVARILPGGLNILGVFAVCSPEVCVVKGLGSLLEKINAPSATLLVHVDARRGTIRVSEHGTNHAYRVQNTDLLHELVEVRSVYRFVGGRGVEGRAENAEETLGDVIRRRIVRELDQRVSQLMIAEKGQALGELVKEHVRRGGLDHVPLHLFALDSKGVEAAPNAAAGSVVDAFVPDMNLTCRAYVFERETIEDARREVRDVSRPLAESPLTGCDGRHAVDQGHRDEPARAPGGHA